MSRVSSTPGTLADRLAARSAASPAKYGPGWVALSEYYADRAMTLVDAVAATGDHVDDDLFTLDGTPLRVSVFPKAAGKHPGRCINNSRIDLDGSLLPVPPESLDLTCEDHRAAFAALHGVYHHEVGHAMFSRWGATRVADATPAERELASVLEEARMEARLVGAVPAARPWLAAAVEQLLLAELELPASLDAAVQTWLLVGGRVAAGILPAPAAEGLRAMTALMLDLAAPGLFEVLQDVLAELASVADDDAGAMISLARRVIAATPVRTRPGEGDGRRAPGPSGPGASPASSPSSPDGEGSAAAGEGSDDPDGTTGADGDGGDGADGADGDGADGDGCGAGGTGPELPAPAALSAKAIAARAKELREELSRALAEAGEDALAELSGLRDGEVPDSAGPGAGDSASGASGEVPPSTSGAPSDLPGSTRDRLTEEMSEATARSKATTWDDTSKVSADAGHVLDAAAHSGSHGGCADDRPTAARGTRLATTAEQVARHALAARLRKARFRQRRLERVPGALPPGRLDGRAAMQESAQRSLGRVPSAKPWKRARRLNLPSPKIRLAVLADVSGSMGSVAAHLSSTLWTLPAAVADAGGRGLSVTFGGHARIVTDTDSHRPTPTVVEFVADAATEAIADALDLAIDRLDLLKVTDGERGVVVIVSDGYWVDPKQRVRADAVLERLIAHGTLVLLVGVGEAPMAHPATRTDMIATHAALGSGLETVVGPILTELLRAAPSAAGGFNHLS